MPQIRPLDPVLVNKIAAGEVIERPASVVKELLENALDAGATRLDVTLEDGGTTLISISDDGGGIDPDDLPLAVAAHATSKIVTVDDLFNIRTMGFRGEALASIASVSRLKLISRPPERGEGAFIESSDGHVGPVTPCAASPGTTVEVRNLFHNVPARLKFLRSASAELGHVTEQIARIALARPDVSITQSHGGRVVRKLPATTDRRARIADFYGEELACSLIPFTQREPDLQLDGLFAPPAESKANSRWQYVFLNGRFIRDRELTGFVFREAFRGLIEPARYPVVFLFLTADPSQFDINVHPTKIEVRWRDAGRVKSQVLAVLREVILSRDLTPTLRPRPVSPVDPVEAQQNVAAFADHLRAFRPGVVVSGADGSGAGVQGSGFRVQGEIPGATRPTIDLPREGDHHTWAHEPGANAIHGTVADRSAERQPFRGPRSGDAAMEAQRPPPDFAPAGAPASRAPLGPNDRPAPRDTNANDSSPERVALREGVPATLPGRAIQIHNTYLVCETPGGMLIIDQHALHERIMYESLRERITRGPLESQHLLLPETFDVSPTQLAALAGAVDVLNRLGLEAEPFGPRAIAVRRAPSLLGDANLREFVTDLLDKLAESDRHDSDALLNDVLAMMACKAAVKAGDRLTPELIEALLQQRHLVEKSSNCPHGRPTTLQLTIGDLERQFKRT